eukprot:scaffold335846_cov20-Prasinocladus_malaysianus.AAC.1
MDSHATGQKRKVDFNNNHVRWNAYIHRSCHALLYHSQCMHQWTGQLQTFEFPKNFSVAPQQAAP